MIIDLSEEEREFLERVVIRAQKFLNMNLPYNPFLSEILQDMEKLDRLKEKLKNDH